MSGYEAAERLAKASRLTNLLRATSIGSVQTKAMKDEQWWQLAIAAADGDESKAKVSSKETREMVVEMIRAREDAALEMSGINPDSWRKTGGLIGAVDTDEE